MLRKFRRNLRLRRIESHNNSILQLALATLDRPTDLKDEFCLTQTLDLDHLNQHVEAAKIAEPHDAIVTKDIRLATLRAYCSTDSTFAFQCLSAMPELLDDARARRSLHTYFNRLGVPEFAESLLGPPEFIFKKKSRTRQFLKVIAGRPQKLPETVPASIEEDRGLIQDLRDMDLTNLGPRLIRHLAQNEINQFIHDIQYALQNKNIDLRRKREIIYQSGILLLSLDIDITLDFYKEVSAIASDARLLRRIGSALEKRGRSEEAIEILSAASDQTTQRLHRSIKERLEWRINGYNLDVLKPEIEYKPIEDRVLYHVHTSIDYTTAGYSTRTHYICKSLLEQGVDLHVRTRWGYPCDRKEVDLEPNQIENTIIDGVEYLHDPELEAFGTYAMEDYAVRAAYSLLASARKIRPSVIHAASNHSVGFPAAMVARALNIPFVYEMRGLWALSRAAKDPEYRRGDRFQLEMALERHVAMAANHVIAITDGLRAQLIEWGIPKEKISLAPNCVDSKTFTIKDRHKQLERAHMLNGKTVIGYVGSLAQYEGLDHLLEAVSYLPLPIKNKISVLIVGDGQMRSTLEAKASELGLNQIVKFTGKVPLEQVNDYYSLIDIAPFPRISAEVCEMISPLKPLEAMAMGSVVLASNVRAIAEHVISDKNGMLFEKEDSHDLSQKLKALIEDTNLAKRLSQSGRTWVENYRSWDRMASIIDSVYRHCTKGANLLEWDLDVLPSVIQKDRLTGEALSIDELVLTGPSKGASNYLHLEFASGDGWNLASNCISLTPHLSSIEHELKLETWSDSMPAINHVTISRQHPDLNEFTFPMVHEHQPSEATLFVCDKDTTEADVHMALLHHSILVSERSAYLHGFVGILTELENLPTIFQAIVERKEEHGYQRKENWRRLVLSLHPILRLTSAAYDKSYIRKIDPFCYELVVSDISNVQLSQFVSQILCQRIRPHAVTVPSEVEQTGEWLLAINALLVNNIEVHQSDEPLFQRSIQYDPLLDEHVGLDFVLNETLTRGVVEQNLSLLETQFRLASINKRVLIIGHDLKFISQIAETWRSWGVEVTLLKSKNHSGSLDVTDQELMQLMSEHDILFCEWALGNAHKISQYRGNRPISIRYHLQERNTEYILDANLLDKDQMIFVSNHTMKDEPRLSGLFNKIVIGNAVDCLDLNVERKDALSMGLIGITPQRKRFDFALSIIQKIQEKYPSTQLILKGKLPKDFPWMKRKDQDNDWYEKLFESHREFFSQRTILQEGFTPKIGSFFSTISTMLSVSDFESFHLAPAEGAAARTEVLMLSWTGAEEIHNSDWISDSISGLADKYLYSKSRGLNYENGEGNRQYVMARYELRSIAFEMMSTISANVVRTSHTKPPNLITTPSNSLLPHDTIQAERMWMKTLVHDDYSLHKEADEVIRKIPQKQANIVILTAHMDLNLIDGSAIWYASMAEMLAETGLHVVCAIPSEAESSPILQPLHLISNVSILTPNMMGHQNVSRKLSHTDYVSMVVSLAEYLPGPTKVFSRGFDLVQDLALNEEIELWAYLTDYYSHDEDGQATVKQPTSALVRSICESKGRILCQTSLIQDELAKLSGMPLKHFVDLPPMIPDQPPQPMILKKKNNVINVVYAGKMAPLWGVEPLLNAACTSIVVTVIGDKIHNGPASDSTFRSRITKKLESSKHIEWIHRLPRKEVLKHVGTADIAWCARDAYFENQTRELSTKVLECVLVGTPPIVTRSNLHEELLGCDWPFFVNGPNDHSWQIDLFDKCNSIINLLPAIQERIKKHSLSYVSRSIRKLLELEV
ncbi:MAG: glycosyltransferase [archaeon]|nr:glycosyltransferase [archaeon]